VRTTRVGEPGAALDLRVGVPGVGSWPAAAPHGWPCRAVTARTCVWRRRCHQAIIKITGRKTSGKIELGRSTWSTGSGQNVSYWWRYPAADRDRSPVL